MEWVFSLSLALGATITLLRFGQFKGPVRYRVSQLSYVNQQSRYQVLIMSIALLIIVLLYLFYPQNFMSFFAVGQLDAKASAVPWFGIRAEESWLALGSSLAFFITLITSTFVYLQFRKSVAGFKALIPYFPWVVLFALTNSFGEEVIYRLAILVPLVGHIDTAYVLLISAVIFGAPHLRGMPNGLVGAVMAGVLGWLLAKSVVETHGLFWAWTIHFLQDLVIFSAFILSALNDRS